MSSLHIHIALISIAIVINPTFGLEQTKSDLLAQRSQWEHSRWLSTKWEAIVDGSTIAASTKSLLAAEQYELLVEANRKRKEKHGQLARVFLNYELSERRAKLLDKRIPKHVVDQQFPVHNDWVEPTLDDVKVALRTYKTEQDKSEYEWAAEVDEILTPDQFDGFIALFPRGIDFMASPLWSRYLGLSVEQAKEIDLLCATAKQASENARKQIAEAARKNGTPPDYSTFLHDQQLRRNYFVLFEKLSEEQFTRIAKIVLIKDGESFQSLRDRLQLLDPGDSFPKTIIPLVNKVIQN